MLDPCLTFNIIDQVILQLVSTLILFLVIPSLEKSAASILLLLRLNEELSNFTTSTLSRLPTLTEE